MAEDATTTDATTDATTDDTIEKGGETGKTFTQEQVNDLLARQKGDVQRRFSDYDELKAKAGKLDEIETANQSDLEKVTSERDTLKGELTPLQTENLRLRVALDKKLPPELIDRLKGSNKEEMESDADELLKLVGGQQTTDFEGGAREEVKSDDMNSLIRRAAGRQT